MILKDFAEVSCNISYDLCALGIVIMCETTRVTIGAISVLQKILELLTFKGKL